MEVLFDLLKISIPAIIVAYMSYVLVRSFLQSKLDEVVFAIRQKNQEIIIPIRLQSYERICLLLERISHANLIHRLNNGQYSAEEFHHILVHEVREEFNHNLSQQVYMSADAWTYVTSAVEQVISEINAAANEMKKDATSIDLAKALFMMESQKQVHILHEALGFIKREIQELF